jgi:hypothetical protein
MVRPPILIDRLFSQSSTTRNDSSFGSGIWSSRGQREVERGRSNVPRSFVFRSHLCAGFSDDDDHAANAQRAAVGLTWWLGTERQQQPRTRLDMSAGQLAQRISVPSPAMPPHSDVTQMPPSPQASTSGSLPSTSAAVATTSGAPSQQSPQMTHSPPIRTNKLPVLPEDRFKVMFVSFSRSAGIRISECDFIIEGRLVNPWLLHRAVFSRGGFVPVRLY